MNPGIHRGTSIGFIAVVILILCHTAPSWAQRLSVKSDIGNIRSGPGLKNEVLWQVEKYYPIKVLQQKGSWFLFKDFEGDQGWVHQSLLAKTETVITKSEKCNIRSGPGTKHKIEMTVEKGIPFKVLEKKGAWIHIQHADGDRGWIHKSLVW